MPGVARSGRRPQTLWGNRTGVLAYRRFRRHRAGKSLVPRPTREGRAPRESRSQRSGHPEPPGWGHAGETQSEKTEGEPAAAPSGCPRCSERLPARAWVILTRHCTQAPSPPRLPAAFLPRLEQLGKEAQRAPRTRVHTPAPGPLKSGSLLPPPWRRKWTGCQVQPRSRAGSLLLKPLHTSALCLTSPREGGPRESPALLQPLGLGLSPVCDPVLAHGAGKSRRVQGPCRTLRPSPRKSLPSLMLPSPTLGEAFAPQLWRPSREPAPLGSGCEDGLSPASQGPKEPTSRARHHLANPRCFLQATPCQTATLLWNPAQHTWPAHQEPERPRVLTRRAR